MAEKVGNIYSKMTPEKRAAFKQKQGLPYPVKVNYAKARVREFIQECGRRDLNPYVSVGGLDSITLLCFIRSLGYDVPAVSVSHLEHVSIQRVHRQLGVECIKPLPREGGVRGISVPFCRNGASPSSPRRSPCRSLS